MGGLGGGPGSGGGGPGGGDGDDLHTQVWFRGGSGMLTLQETPSTPSQVKTPRQPTAHIVPFGRHPNVLPSTHAACDSCFVHEHDVDGGEDDDDDDDDTAPLSAAVVQFIIGVVNMRGDARMAHIENSVIDSSSVTLGGPSVGSYPEAGPVPV